MATLSFLGAAGTVTGSCTMLDATIGRCLVDCGMFQGNKTIRELNEKPFPFDATTIQYVLLTHAHTDHAGLLPKLVKAGFVGPIYATEATVDLLEFMMRDSAKIQESETERQNRWRQRRGKPTVEPVFTMEHAETTLKRLKPVDYETWFEPAPGFHSRYWNAGHILGSASIEARFVDGAAGNTMHILFSGDIGPEEKTFHPEPEAERGFDYVVCESTYGDRERADYTLDGRRSALRHELVEGLRRGGNVIIPAFAVERSQELLHDIGTLLARGEIPNATVFLDSPLASSVTDVFIKHADTLDDIEIPEAELFRNPHFRIIQDVEESKGINRITSGAIIISASGMAEGGRVLHHLRHNIWRREATILFVGYQAPGTLGEVIRSGKSDVRIHGKVYKVEAAVRSLDNYSAHADQSELVDWIVERRPIVGGLFLNHGDDAARSALRRLLGENGVDTAMIHMPAFDESFALTAGPPASKGRAPARIHDAELQRDWFNDFAAFEAALSNRLDAEPDPERRRAIVRSLTEALERA